MILLNGLSKVCAISVAILHLTSAASAEPSDIPLPNPKPFVATDSISNDDVEAVESSEKSEELICLAQSIYFEARGEPARGQLAVGRVVLNRVDSRSYPDSICGVVYQNAHWFNRCQFSFACDGDPETVTEPKKWEEALSRAEDLLTCEERCHSNESRRSLWASTHYHADYVNPGWAARLIRTAQVGRHIFYLDESVKIAMR